ncbi:hypothetical protein Ccrd_010462 [Cynara cardunculus var. scolymus]|uniref:Uncharacterized protein n=1 Tax=Cynara cardunculus var. scolymus TaxID=59895 RepID=A0A124SHZ9_CYNCS|nr:hypothetical protein Ccrd_010462 [Cynara cardunculus var. scolymus]
MLAICIESNLRIRFESSERWQEQNYFQSIPLLGRDVLWIFSINTGSICGSKMEGPALDDLIGDPVNLGTEGMTLKQPGAPKDM